MAYKLKPNYHFSDMNQTGIDVVPVGRFIIVEDVGNAHEIKWYKKTSNDLVDSEGTFISTMDENTTLNDALGNFALISPLDEKRDILDSYSQTEVDSMLTVKADWTNVYDRTEAEATFRSNLDSYSATEVDALLDQLNRNTDGIVESSAVITADYAITSGANAMSLGPITINDGITVTIPDNSVWQII